MERDEQDKWSREDVDAFIQKRDLLPNLQLLPGAENLGKSDQACDDWAREAYPTPESFGAFIERNALPAHLPHDVDDFPTFFDERRTKLASRIEAKMRTLTHEVQLEPGAATMAADINDALAEADSEE
jgi:hypothetical protein